MIGRILRIVFIVFLIGLAVKRLFGRKRAVRNAVQTGAWVLLGGIGTGFGRIYIGKLKHTPHIMFSDGLNTPLCPYEVGSLLRQTVSG